MTSKKPYLERVAEAAERQAEAAERQAKALEHIQETLAMFYDNGVFHRRASGGY